MDELPVVRGLIVCERVEQDRRTGTVSVHGRFNQLRVPAFPSPPRLVSVYAAVANGAGVVPFDVVVTRLASEAEVRLVRRSVYFADRLAEVQLLFHIAAFSFPGAGGYEFTLFAGDEPLASQRVQVVGPFGGADAV